MPGRKDGQGKLEVHRSKGRLLLEDGGVRMLQGVREVFELADFAAGEPAESLEGKMVFIGRGVADAGLEASLGEAISGR